MPTGFQYGHIKLQEMKVVGGLTTVIEWNGTFVIGYFEATQDGLEIVGLGASPIKNIAGWRAIGRSLGS